MRELDPNSLGDHLDRLYRAAWALTGSREDAEDLVQDTYMKILARPRFLRGEEDLWYLMRTLKNVFLSQRRTLARRSPPVPVRRQPRPCLPGRRPPALAPTTPTVTGSPTAANPRGHWS